MEQGNIEEAETHYKEAIVFGDPDNLAKVALKELPSKTVEKPPVNPNEIILTPEDGLNRTGEIFAHYGMYKRYGSFMKMIPFPEDMYCQVQGCNSICMNSGGVTGTGRNKIGYRFCSVHYSRMDTNGITELLPLTVTRPMKIFEAQCNKYGITIDEKEKKIGIYPVDYVIKNIVVQIDGNFYHANPKPYSLFTNAKAKRPTSFKGYKSNDMIFNRTAKEIWVKDKRRDKVVREAGYEVIRFWESDIIMKPEQCMKYLLSRLAVYTIVI